MGSPVAITVGFRSSASLMDWRIDDPRVEGLWLPIVGPTPLVLLRLFHNDCSDLFDVHTYTIEGLAERVGVKGSRAFQSVLRLRRHRLIFDDDETTDFDHPCYRVPYNVRPVNDGEFRVLPQSVRDVFDQEGRL